MPHKLVDDTDFWVAALSQTFVSAWKLDPDGMYAQIGYGRIEMFSEERVRLRLIDGSFTHLEREATRFEHNKRLRR
ncbi:hypothetical protein ACE6ED_25180 [Paenibacillus sp. CN-4]|uniref:hypothetical protein n=1 Tax=Paenibacillus nanchangensis TaxID=3348343 RepID=UPI00397B89CF